MTQSHYFNPDPNLRHQIRIINYSIEEHDFNFETDNGVFSKEQVDYGTHVLLKAILKDQDFLANMPEIEALDFGCGYGVVSIVLQKLFLGNNVFEKQNWTGIDINSRAIDLARNNAKRSGVSVVYEEADGIPNDYKLFDLIVLNPPIRTGKSIYYKMFQQAAIHLNKEGVFYIVIQKKQGAKSAKTYLETLFDHVRVIDKTGGYHTIRCQYSKL